MGTVQVDVTVRYCYTIDDTGFSGSEIVERQLEDPVGSAIDAYLEREEGDKTEVVSQTVTVEQETSLTNDDLLFEGECVILPCSHVEYRDKRCVVEGCSNWIGLTAHRTIVKAKERESNDGDLIP